MPATATATQTKNEAGSQPRGAMSAKLAAGSKAVLAAMQNRRPIPPPPVSTTRFPAPMLDARHNSPGSANANEAAEPADPSRATAHHHILLDPGLTLEMGEHTYIHDSRILNPSGALTGIRIGKFCAIATELTIIGYDHHSEWISTYPFLDDGNRQRWSGTEGIPYPQAARFGSNKSRGDISIGHDVWIGYGVKLFKGVTIGNGAVIGACSLVNKSVEPYTVVAGIPARPIRKRFSDEEIAFLQEIQWWDWPEAFINRHMNFLCSSKPGEFERRLQEDPDFQQWVRDGRPTSRPAQAAIAPEPNPRLACPNAATSSAANGAAPDPTNAGAFRDLAKNQLQKDHSSPSQPHTTKPISEGLVCTEIAPGDEMFTGDRAHYFGVGQSADQCIRSALDTAKKPAREIQRILDLPCGHGRVMRFLKAAFPHASLTACDLNRGAVDFCARTFGAEPVFSNSDVNQIPLQGKFDLIWCGSLLTHLRAEPCADLVRWFNSHLNLGALLVFTVHGRWVERSLATGRYKYGLPDERISALLKDYYDSGFGYADYPGQTNYGISVCSPAYIAGNLVSLPDLKLVAYHEKGWDNHQDVVCLQKQGPTEFLG